MPIVEVIVSQSESANHIHIVSVFVVLIYRCTSIFLTERSKTSSSSFVLYEKMVTFAYKI